MCVSNISNLISINVKEVGPIVPTTQIKSILGVYEEASGQSINYGKFGILFSLCIAQDVKEAISDLLGVHLCNIPPPPGRVKYNYLGLPSPLRRSKRHIFSFLKDSVWKRINNWNSYFLSRAGREILIKVVIQAIPTYCMNVFLLPAAICHELQVLMNKF
ncbi:hypothetical protein K2173_017436 [Erythroxylum novogranatense]|uniref:Uncharacterized protein n=1 Tax=Erythroxylum novogranatense TaxID=1862640 RepID=A0AAV8TKF1_9ROSI|nr:hypothetical protein K2173_017436 [Erythroxylum novogranatense]